MPRRSRRTWKRPAEASRSNRRSVGIVRLMETSGAGPVFGPRHAVFRSVNRCPETTCGLGGKSTGYSGFQKVENPPQYSGDFRLFDCMPACRQLAVVKFAVRLMLVPTALSFVLGFTLARSCSHLWAPEWTPAHAPNVFSRHGFSWLVCDKRWEVLRYPSAREKFESRASTNRS